MRPLRPGGAEGERACAGWAVCWGGKRAGGRGRAAGLRFGPERIGLVASGRKEVGRGFGLLGCFFWVLFLFYFYFLSLNSKIFEFK